jgi:hypothetical protein
VRDRLIGVAFGLIVFGIVEHFLWPVRAADRMHARLADVFRSLAALARVVSRPPADVDARRQLIGQQVADVQGFIESSKFEPGTDGRDALAVERLTADAQAVFVVLLAIAREAGAAGGSEAVAASTSHVEENVAAILEGVADRTGIEAVTPMIDLDRSLADLDRSLATQTDASSTYQGALVLYRELGIAVHRVASDDRRTIVAVSPAA